MASSTRVTVTWSDRYGNSARVVFHVDPAVVDPTDASIQLVVAAIQYFTKCVGITIEISRVKAVSDTPGTTAYANVEDKVISTFLDASSGPHNWKIAGIKTTLLQSDKETLDGTNATVATWTAAVIANAVGSNNDPIVSFSGGHRTISRKLNKY